MMAALPAQAQKPLSICGGKYAEAAEIADGAIAKYGTVYSGGDHWHRLDSIGGTLDLYRLWRGYPDVKLRSTFKAPGTVDGEDTDFPSNEYLIYKYTPDDVWDLASWSLHPGGPKTPTRLQAFWAGYGLDRLTSVGTSPGWWRTMKSPNAADGGLAWVAAKARTEPGLDWLQYAIAASGAPWANSWAGVARADQDTRDDFHANAFAAFERYRAGEGIEWLVAAAINEPQINTWPALAGELRKLRDEVKACTATPARYAAYAATRDVMERDIPETGGRTLPPDLHADLPEYIRSMVAANTLGAYLREQAATGGKFDRLPPEDRRAELPYMYVELARLYSATRIEDVPFSALAYIHRAYNLLSVDNLRSLAERGPPPLLAQPRNQTEAQILAEWQAQSHNDLIQVVFARYVALGRTRDAAAYLPTFKATLKGDLPARVDRIWAMRQPERIRLALIALEVPNLSTLHKSDRWSSADDGLWFHLKYVEFRRNLPVDYASGEFMQRDFETALVEPNRYGAFWNLHGISIGWVERITRRDGYDLFWHSKPSAPSILPGPNSTGVPFMKLVARDEVKRLAGDQRLTTVIAAQVLEWGDQQSRIPAMREEAATTLSKLITMCKYNACGKVHGQYPGARALQIIKARLKQTNAGRRTRWWYSVSED